MSCVKLVLARFDIIGNVVERGLCEVGTLVGGLNIILRRIEPCIIINVHSVHVRFPLYFSGFNES